MECDAKEESEKKIRRKRGREGGTRSFTLTPTPPPRCFFFFFSHLFVVSPRSERLEQTTLLIPETLFFELSAANSIPAFMFLRYSSILFGIVPSVLIIFGTTFTLSIFHNSHSRSKNINSVSLCGFSFTVISSECDTRITLTAQAKGIGATGNENYIFLLLLFLLLIIIIIIILYFLLMRSVFRRCVSGNPSLEVSALRQWLPIRAHKSFHRCVLCSNFRWPFSTSLFFFAFWLLPFLYCGGAI